MLQRHNLKTNLIAWHSDIADFSSHLNLIGQQYVLVTISFLTSIEMRKKYFT
jgi:hypothetical protein